MLNVIDKMLCYPKASSTGVCAFENKKQERIFLETVEVT